jgi:hypothetical protein
MCLAQDCRWPLSGSDLLWSTEYEMQPIRGCPAAR